MEAVLSLPHFIYRGAIKWSPFCLKITKILVKNWTEDGNSLKNLKKQLYNGRWCLWGEYWLGVGRERYWFRCLPFCKMSVHVLPCPTSPSLCSPRLLAVPCHRRCSTHPIHVSNRKKRLPRVSMLCKSKWVPESCWANQEAGHWAEISVYIPIMPWSGDGTPHVHMGWG